MPYSRLTEHKRYPPTRYYYGKHSSQFGHLYRGLGNRLPGIVVLIHGGFWQTYRSLDIISPLAEELSMRGADTWNIEYRRVGEGNWEATLNDCAAAIDYLHYLAPEHGIDTANVWAVGHSAGGHLAVWAAGRRAVAERESSGVPNVSLRGAVSLSGILDLRHAWEAGLGNGALADFLGVSREEDFRPSAEVDPLSRLPIGVPIRCFHGSSDTRVPITQSSHYVEAARGLGDDAELVEVPGTHSDMINVHRGACWQAIDGVLEFVGRARERPTASHEWDLSKVREE